MIIEIFLLWTFWFWLLVGIEVMLLFVSTVWEKSWVAWVSLALFLAALQLFGDVNVLSYVWNNPTHILYGIAIYFLGGSIYVFPKWYLFVTDHKRKYLDFRDQFLIDKGLEPTSYKGNPLPDELVPEFREVWGRQSHWSVPLDVEFRPKARNHKARIIDWMMLWPFNGLWTMLNDPVRRLFRHVYYQIADVLQGISDRAFADVVNDLEKKIDTKPTPPEA